WPLDGRLHGAQGPPHRHDGERRLVLRDPRCPRRRGDRHRQVQHRADHAGGAAARRGPGDGHGDAPPRAGQLAWIQGAASEHGQHNPHALLREVVTVEEVVSSPIIADPLHRLDCCVITDGGGAIVVTKPEVAKSLKRPLVRVLGAGEAVKHQMGGKVDLTYTGAVWSGPAAFAEAGVTPSDVKYVSIYDSFTITVLITLEDLGFCPKGQGGKLVADGNLISGVGRLPFNTDGGGLCNNHPGNRGGLTKVVEAVRQLRGEAHPKVQVRNCDVALAHGTGGSL